MFFVLRRSQLSYEKLKTAATVEVDAYAENVVQAVGELEQRERSLA